MPNVDFFQKENLPFLEQYFQNYIERFIDSPLSLNPSIDENKIICQKKAFQYGFSVLFSNPEKILTEEFVIQLANLVNESALYISNGYRKIGNTFLDTPKKIANAMDISKEMKELFTLYEGAWQKDSFLEREVQFHMRFCQIHPFEDGNGRVARMLLCFHLLKEGHVPLIIHPHFFKEYQTAMYYDDAKAISQIFQIEYENEEKEFLRMWKEYQNLSWHSKR